MNSYTSQNFSAVDVRAGQQANIAGISAESENRLMARIKLSHTPAEHQLYEALLNEMSITRTRIFAFSLRKLMALAELPNYSAVRRALSGLVQKLSIEEHKVAGDMRASVNGSVYLVFNPKEIIARRAATVPGREDIQVYAAGQAVERLAVGNQLSRREAEVALCCVEGLTNNEIGERLHISVQTVKYHMRHIFVKYNVRRRAELVSRLLAQEGSSSHYKGRIEQ